MKKLIALALLALSAVAHAAPGGGNDVIYSEPFWWYLLNLWNNWDGFFV